MASVTPPNFYDLLGVAQGASANDIKLAFRRKALHFHPDKNPSKDAEETMKWLNKAHETLSNERKKAIYDAEQAEASGEATVEITHWLFGEKSPAELFREQMSFWRQEWSSRKRVNFPISFPQRFDTLMKEKLKKDWPTVATSPETKLQCMRCDALFSSENELANHKDGADEYKEFIESFKRESNQSSTQVISGPSSPFSDFRTVQSLTPAALALARSLCACYDVARSDQAGAHQDIQAEVKLDSKWLHFLTVKSKVPSLGHAPPLRPSAIAQIREELERYPRKSNKRSTAERVPIFAVANQQALLSALSLSQVAELPSVLIKEPPVWEPNAPTCQTCTTKFGFFRRRHHCRGCGRCLCSSCLLRRPIPKFGFLGSVLTCQNCLDILGVESSAALVAQAKTITNSAAAVNLLGAAHEIFRFDDEKKWANLGNEMKTTQASLLCYLYANIGAEKWGELAFKHRNDQVFSCCIDAFAAQQPSQAQWKQLHQQLAQDGTTSAARFHALQVSNASSEDWLAYGTQAFMKREYEWSWACFSAVAKKLKPTEWINRGNAEIGTHGVFELAIQYYKIGEAPISAFLNLLVLIDKQPAEYRQTYLGACMKVIELIFYPGSYNLAQEWEAHSRNPVVLSSARLAWTLLLRSTNNASPSIWLDKCVSLLQLPTSNQPNITVIAQKCLAKVLSDKSFDWRQYRDRLRPKSDDTSQALALFCSRVLSSAEWSQMGHEALIAGHFQEAVKFFAMAGQEINTNAWWEKQAQSFEATPPLALKCLIMAWSKSQTNSSSIAVAQAALKSKQTSFAALLCAAILRSAPSRKDEAKVTFLLIEILQGANFGPGFIIQAYQFAEQKLSPEPLPDQHQRQLRSFVTKAAKESATKGGSSQATKLQKLFSEGKYEAFYDLLLGEVFNSDDRSRRTMVDEFLTLQLSYGPLEPRPAPDKGVLYLVRGVQHLLQGRWAAGVQDLLNAALTFPNREAMWRPVANILSCPRLRAKIFVQELQQISNQPFQSLRDTPISIKAEYEHKDKLRPNVESRILFGYERGIYEQFSKHTDPAVASREVALSYRNLAAAGQSHTSAVVSLLHSALWFLADIDKQSDPAEKYVSKRAIVDTLVEAYALSCRGSIAQRSTIGRIGSGILIQAVSKLQGGFLSPEELERETHLTVLFLSTYFDALPLYPVPPSLQVARVADWQYFGLVQHMLVREMFRALQVHPSTELLPSHVLNYYRYEADLMGWCPEGPDSDVDDDDEEKGSDSENEQDIAARDRAKQIAKRARDERVLELRRQKQEARRRLRAECVETMLASKNWDVEQVKSLLQWSMLPRTPDGWLLPQGHQLKLRGEGFASMDGVTFNIETGDIKLLLRRPSPKEHALFDWGDIATVLRHGIGSTFFSLDAPSEKFTYHPFQLMHFGPPQLWESDYLATMFHTDYLLKFFSTGMEVAALPPFEMRPTAALVARLPPKLQAVVQSIPNRRGRTCVGAAHRFWIEAGEIPYSVDSGGGDNVTFRFGSVPMQVKKHLLERDEKGNLVDASDTDDMAGGPGSAESRFAAEFTQNFDEIGQYFPEFLRLRQLLKLSAAVCVIASHKKNLEDNANDPSLVDKQAASLSEATRKMGRYPKASDSSLIDELLEENVQNVRSRVEKEHGYSAWTSALASEARSHIRPQILQQLQEADTEILNKLCSQFAEGTGKSAYTVRPDVLSLLRGDSRPLARLMVAHQTQKPLNALNRQLQQISFHEPAKFEAFSNSNGNCVWIPSAIRQESVPGALFSVYGGVCLNVNLQKSFVGPTSASAASVNTANQQAANQFGSASRQAHIRNAGLAGLVQNHHVIPQSLQKNPEAAAVLQRANFSMHHQSNIMLMPNKQGAEVINTNRTVHQGSHPAYNAYVTERVVQIGRDTNHLPQAFTQARVTELRSALRQEIRSGDVPWGKS